MNYWLLKSEPITYSIDHLARRPEQRDRWDGVRNYQARNFLREQIKVGDLAFFYHSSCTPPGIAGIVKVVKAGYPDPTAFDPTSKYYDAETSPAAPRWFSVDVQLQKVFKHLITLEQLKQQPALATMRLLQKGNRLSVLPVSAEEWSIIMGLV